MRALVLFAAAIPALGAAYPGTGENFPNPERGFFVQTSRPLTATFLRRARDNGMSLVRVYWQISEYRDGPLDAALLGRVRADFATARAQGFKIIGRFAYNNGPSGEPDAPLDRVLGHIDQITAVMRENSDVLAFLEAGFIGAWGEWHHSTNGLEAHTREIVERLLAALPDDRMIALRTPRQKTDLYGSTPLTATEAFGGTPRSRIGAHNDCFLASNTDWGTWTTRNIDTEKAFYHQDHLFVPQGGETCNAKEDAQPYIGCENALRELAYQRFDTLNSLYHLDVLAGWTKGGCMPEIQRRLGYRFRILDTSDQIEGQELHMEIGLRNEGFGNLYNPRPVFLVARDRATGRIVRQAIDTDPRRWMPGETTRIRAKVALPAGDYDILLHLPDAAEALRARSEYSVRFGNADIWESATGMNRLFGTVQIAP